MAQAGAVVGVDRDGGQADGGVGEACIAGEAGRRGGEMNPKEPVERFRLFPKSTPIYIARCEGCGGDAIFSEWPAGWVQISASKYGVKYEQNGIAWWCPVCRKKHDPRGA